MCFIGVLGYITYWNVEKFSCAETSFRDGNMVKDENISCGEILFGMVGFEIKMFVQGYITTVIKCK